MRHSRDLVPSRLVGPLALGKCGSWCRKSTIKVQREDADVVPRRGAIAVARGEGSHAHLPCSSA
jgi:hypothetical protein